MIHVLIPAMGKSLFFKDSYFPKPMIEVAGETMLERVVRNFAPLAHRDYVFVFDRKDCMKFHLDASARILTEPQTHILSLEGQTAGALCTCLMAVDFINDEDPLLIANCDQIIDVDYNDVIQKFEQEQADAGVITFDSVHPRWSYVRMNDAEEIVEVAEKHPLSKHAIAGCYYFRHGKDFIEAAKRVVLKGESKDGVYYISSTLNEIILDGGKVLPFPIAKEAYHSFYSPEKIKEYETYQERVGI